VIVRFTVVMIRALVTGIVVVIMAGNRHSNSGGQAAAAIFTHKLPPMSDKQQIPSFPFFPVGFFSADT